MLRLRESDIERRCARAPSSGGRTRSRASPRGPVVGRGGRARGRLVSRDSPAHERLFEIHGAGRVRISPRR